MSAERPDVLELTKRLIAIESHAEAPGREAEVGRFLMRWFHDRGIDADLLAVDGDRSNVIARIPGGGGPSLMLCGHLDTVPAGDMAYAFVPRVEDGVLRGRGACDMKGAVAAMACALASIQTEHAPERRSAPLEGDLLFLGTVDEETGGLGVKAAIDAGIRADRAVVGEPTDLRVALAHKGACFVRITLIGRGAHGSCPERGISAVSYATRIVRAVEAELRSVIAGRTHRLLGRSTVNVGRVCGGTQPNIVAERCEIDIDRRTVPGDDDALAEIRELVEGICSGVDGLASDVEEMAMTSVVPHVALETSPDAPLARAAIAAIASNDLPAEPIGVTYWTDGGHLAASGIETVVLGPGEIANAHGPSDRVPIEQLRAAVDVYGAIARRLLTA